MRYLVTGATGNLARQIVDALLAEGEQVSAMDIHSPADVADGEKLSWGDVSFTIADITDAEAMRQIIEAAEPEVVLHMASLLSSSSEANPMRAWAVNAQASVDLLEFCRTCGVRQFFYPSTVATYAAPLPDPLPEDQPQWPNNIYGVTKVAIERVGSYYAASHGLDFRALRFPVVISPYAPEAAVSAYASHAFAAAARGRKLTFPVTREVAVSTIYVRDIVDGVLQYLSAPQEKLTRRVYNIHSFAATAGEIADEIARQAPSFTFEFAPQEFVMQVLQALPSAHVDTTAREDWGWAPKYDLAATTLDMLRRFG